MADGTRVNLTAHCAPAPADDTILLPQAASQASGRRLLVEGNGKSRLLKPGVRADSGTAACVSATTLATYGGNNASVTYRGVGFVGRLIRDYGLAIQLAIAVLTLIAAVITAYATYIKSSGKDAGAFSNNTAFIALVVALLLSVLKFVKDYRDL